ncbi:MAG: hypothetical protein ACTH59_07215 [Pseudoalteromonas nigrifaciens]|uniref:hypothetical protein n=1 Tax=Pseudoalteromonas nigrifaciens TaxID=28109 RepID=UPI003F97E032
MKSKFFYIVLSYVIQLLNIILNLVFMQRLSPVILGDLSIAKIWLQAFDYTHLGTRFALDRYLPVTYRPEHRHLYLIIALSVVFVGSFFVFLLSLYFENSNYIVLSFCLVGFSLAFFNVIKAYFRATASIKTINSVMMWLYILPLSLSVIVSIFSFSIFLWVYPITFLLCLLIFIYKNTSLFFSDFNIKHLLVIKRKITSTSKVLFFNSLVIYSTFIIDRFAVDLNLGRETLGLYSVIMFVFASLYIVPSILTELIFPKVVYQVVKEGRLFFLREMLFVLLGTAFAVAVANILMHYLIREYTDYGELLPLMIIASLGVLPYSIIAVFYHIFNALDLRFLLFKMNVSFLFVYVVLLTFVSWLDFGLAYYVYLKAALPFFLLLMNLILIFTVKYKISLNKSIGVS